MAAGRGRTPRCCYRGQPRENPGGTRARRARRQGDGRRATTSPEDPEPRPGAPQGRHAHVLLENGQLALDAPLPRFMAELRVSGAPRLGMPSGMVQWESGAHGGDFVHRPPLSDPQGASRPGPLPGHASKATRRTGHPGRTRPRCELSGRVRCGRLRTPLGGRAGRGRYGCAGRECRTRRGLPRGGPPTPVRRR